MTLYAYLKIQRYVMLVFEGDSFVCDLKLLGSTINKTLRNTQRERKKEGEEEKKNLKCD